VLDLVLTFLQETVPREGRPLVRLLWLWTALAVLGIVLLGLLMWSMRRWKSQLQMSGSRRRARPIKDAWREAGRRAESPSVEELEGREGPG
jgi:hypothetical protein